MAAPNAGANKSIKKNDLWGRPFYGLLGAAVVGAGLAVCLLLGINVAVNVLLLIAASGLHVVVTALVTTFVFELIRRILRVTGSDLGWLAVALAGILAVVGVIGLFLANRFVRRSHLVGSMTATYVVCVIIASGASCVLTIQLLRPGDDSFERPAVFALEGLGGLVLGAIVVVAVVAGAAWRRNTNPPDGPDWYSLPPIAITGEYVAAGDSYSAGEGIRPFNAFTDDILQGNGCHRSEKAYSQLLRFAPPTPAVRFVACSGAVTSDTFRGYPVTRGTTTFDVAPQVEGVHPEVGLVTITMGGNDVVFSDVVVHCFLHTDCLNKQFTPRGDNPDRGVVLPKAQKLKDWADEALQQVKQKAEVLYPKLVQAYPNARIILVGYPYLVPAGGAPIFSQINDCQSILRRFSKPERTAIRELQDRLNQVLHDVASSAEIEFISPADGWAGHEPCGHTKQQYTNSIKPFLQFSNFSKFVDGGTFHPNVAGQRELARLVTCYLANNHTRPVLDSSSPIPGSIGNPIAC